VTAPLSDDDAEVRAALRAHGVEAGHVVPISRPEAQSRRGRRAFRVTRAGGAAVKARRLESEEAARTLCDARRGVDASFSSLLGRHGRVLLEEWVEGDVLTERDVEPWAEEAGRILGRLHAASGGADLPTVEWRALATRALDALERARALSAGRLAALSQGLARLDPGRARAGLVHRDIAPENLVVDRSGRLRVVDNEWFTTAPLGLDLGLTFARWPMSGEAWTRLLDAYRSEQPTDVGSLRFWQCAAALECARIRLDGDADRLAIPLARLRELADALGA